MALKHKLALITGASSGIGWHMAHELAALEHAILAISNQQDQLDDLEKSLQANYNTEVLTFCIDLAQEDAAMQVFEFCQSRNLNVEVLVNNAGMLVTGSVVDVYELTAKKVLLLHVNTPVMLCRLFAPQMISQGKGYILNVSSISAIMPYPMISIYGPTKTFLRYFSRAFGLELKNKGVKVCCIIPGATATNLYENTKLNIKKARRLGIMKMPDEVARKSIKAMFKGRAEYVPGGLNKLIMAIVPLLPFALIRRIYNKSTAKQQ